MCCKCDVTVTFMILMSCDSVFCNASVARLGLGVVTDWWRWWPMANMLACLCSCRWLTFWTYLVTVSLFSRYTMNFMFHIALDALRVHYESMKCDVSFSQGSVSTLFRWGEHVIRVPGMCRNVLPAYSSAKIIKNETRSCRVMTTNVLPRFWWITVYKTHSNIDARNAFFTVRVVVFWNAVPAAVVLSHDVSSFKSE